MKATLIIPDSSLRKEMRLRKRYRLTWTTEHSASHYGMGVMLYPDGEVLDGFNFSQLRGLLGAHIETDDPVIVQRALGLPASEGIDRPA